jgi:hypothetical protein
MTEIHSAVGFLDDALTSGSVNEQERTEERKGRCPYLGAILGCVCDLSVEIKSSISLSVLTIELEVNTMIKTMIIMCLMAGTALAGRSGTCLLNRGREHT